MSVSSLQVQVGLPLQVRNFTFSWNCASSVAQQCRRAILYPFVHRASQGAFCSDPLIRSNTLISTPTMTNIIGAVRFAQSTKVDLKIFLAWVRLPRLFRFLAAYWPTLIWLIVLISKSSSVTSVNPKCFPCIFLVRSFLGRRPLERHFSLLHFTKESFFNFLGQKHVSSYDEL